MNNPIIIYSCGVRGLWTKFGPSDSYPYTHQSLGIPVLKVCVRGITACSYGTENQ
jgi:hypothetical protein